MDLLLLCVWGTCLGLAMFGFGRLLLRVCSWPGSGWALSSAVGFAFLVSIGGVLNLARAVGPPELITLVIVGDVAALLLSRRSFRISFQWMRTTRAVKLLASLLFLLITIEAVGNVRPDVRSFHHNDDLPAYITLPVETHQLGTLPPDPFNERRITSCLGAPYVMESLLLIFSDFRSIRMLDVSIGTILYAGLLLAIFRRLRLQTPAALGLTLLLIAVPLYRFNASMTTLPAALFCALFLLELDAGSAGRFRWQTPMLLGLVTAAVSSLKSNYLPAALLVCGLFFVLTWIMRRRRASFTEGATYVLITMLSLLPWMLDMKQKEGTYLYPLLGRGYDASAYGILPMPNGGHSELSASLWVWLTVLPMAGPLFLAAGATFIAVRKNAEKEWGISLFTFVLGAGVAIAAIASSTGGESIGRYSLPFRCRALLIFAAFLIRWRPDFSKAIWWKSMAIVTGSTLLCLAVLFGVRHEQYRVFLEDARLLAPPDDDWFDMKEEQQRVHALQAAIPAGEPVFARLRVTYPFNFRRNRIFVGDYLGMAGLPPGMPIDQGPQALARYFLNCGIHFIAFDPKRTYLSEDDTTTTIREFLKDPWRYGRHGWVYMQYKVSNSEHGTLVELGKLFPHVYDDGTVYVVDLRRL